MSARLGRNKDAHETLIKGVGQFIFEKEMNKVSLEERRESYYFLSGTLRQASRRKRHLNKVSKKMPRISKGRNGSRGLPRERTNNKTTG